MKRKILKLLALTIPVCFLFAVPPTETKQANASILFQNQMTVELENQVSQGDITFVCGSNNQDCQSTLTISLNNVSYTANEENLAGAMTITNNSQSPLQVIMMISGDNVIQSGAYDHAPIYVSGASEVDIFIACFSPEGATLSLQTSSNGDDYGNQEILPIQYDENTPGRVILLNTLEENTESKNNLKIEPVACGTCVEYYFFSHTHTFVDDYEPNVEQVSTCKSLGIVESYCVYCEDYAYDPTLSPNSTAHNWTTKTAEDGSEYNVCSYCEQIQKVCEHDWTLVQTSSEPNCTTDGTGIYRCSLCGEIKPETIPATGHLWSDWDYIAQPTCTGDGYRSHTCTACNLTQGEVIAPTGHTANYDEAPDYTEPTCVSPGYYTYHCTVCNQEFNILDENAPATGRHTFTADSDYTIEPATCSEVGHAYRECTVCHDKFLDETMTLPIDPDNHSFTVWNTVTEPTCINKGKEISYCDYCDTPTTRDIDALDHNYEVIENVAPTCTEEGYKTYKCSLCGDEYTDELEPLGHTYEAGSRTSMATCTTGSYTQRHCTTCGEWITTSDIGDPDPNAHNLELYAQQNPTCTENGYIEYRCKNCGESFRETLPSEGHSLDRDNPRTVPGTCISNGYTEYYCSTCETWIKDPNSTTTAGGHEWGDWQTIQEATCAQDGIEERVCSVCNESETNTIEGEHTYEILEEKPATCLHEGYIKYYCPVCNTIFDETEILDIDPENHEGVKQLIIDTPATTESDGVGHYEWSCCHYSSPNEPRVIIPKLTVDNSKNIVSDIIGIKTEEPQPGEEPPVKSAVEEALDNISNDTLLDVAEEVNKTFGEIANLENVSEEKKQEYIQTVQAATESAVIAGSKLDNSADEAATISEKMPKNSPIKMDEKLEKFYQLQFDLILGKQVDPSKSRPLSAPFRAGETSTPSGIDYTEGVDVYKQVGEFIDNTVGHMADAASMIRVCSNQKISANINKYIDKIGVKSFRSFDKQAADLEFAENAYQAILINMQEQSISNLNSSYEELSKELTGVALNDLEKEYNSQLQVCNDLESFEWLIIEVMRQKYDSILNNRLEKGEITYDTYVEQFVGDSENDLENFKGIYTNIFYGWALGKDAETYGYTNSYGITLQELTDATITSTSLKQKQLDLSKGATTADIIVAVVFGSLCCLTVGGLVWVEVLKTRKEK